MNPIEGKVAPMVRRSNPSFVLQRPFVFRLALNRRDSNASRRKVSSISISDNSELDNLDGSQGDLSPGPTATAPPAADEKDLSENSLFLLPDDEDHLEQNMPWLRVVTKFMNSFNYFCTHQGFCHPNCYRRQMRAGKRIMEAARRVNFPQGKNSLF